MGDTEHDGQATTRTAAEQAALEKRVHVDLPRVRPEDMVTTQDVDPPQDPRGWPRHRHRVHAAQRRVVTLPLAGGPASRAVLEVRCARCACERIG